MLNVFICEDSKEQREQMTAYIKNYIMIENLDMRFVLSSGDPIEIINHVKESTKTGLYFLDVNLKHEMNGIALAAEIRNYDPRGIIVIITAHPELTYLTFTYKVEAMDYIIKDKITDVQARIIDCIKVANERYMKGKKEFRKKFQQRIQDKVINVYFDEIMFFESSHKLHQVILHLDNRLLEFYRKLKELESLGDEFYRCHNSFLVNKNNIVEIDKKSKTITMRNGEKCFASSRMIKSLLK